MREEFALCVERGVHPLPVGATGFAAKEFVSDFLQLGDGTKGPDALRAVVQRLVDRLQRG